MPYPKSPFTQNLNTQLIANGNVETADSTDLNNTLEWICTCPKITSYRVNTMKSSTTEVKQLIEKKILEKGLPHKVTVHPKVPNVVIIDHCQVNESKFAKNIKEIIVDVDCAAAVLRGAHIFAPGVIGMISGTQIGDKVSIYADLNKKCRKGFDKIFAEEKLFIANGVAKMVRQELFSENIRTSGIAIEITEPISGSAPLGDNFLPPGFALLQNLPSIICIYNLDPQPGDSILDMCASPGNKTTLIAELTKNNGTLVAVDKTPKKVSQLQERCNEFGAKVTSYQANSTKIVATEKIEQEPTFPPESFDRILLDAPCSALGKRPQLSNLITDKILKSYVPLQRKLFHSAVELLRPKGVLVYSTCTITLAENEEMVAWALKTYPYLELFKPQLYLGGHGWQGSRLTEEQRLCVQRFGPSEEVDSVGFFIACFTKK